MTSPHFDFAAEIAKGLAVTAPPKIPRLNSLLHRLRQAKDDAGKPVPLLDELFLFLDDPPAGTGDRWQDGAELCRELGVLTSRMAVWRLYRREILEWRRGRILRPSQFVPAHIAS